MRVSKWWQNFLFGWTIWFNTRVIVDVRRTWQKKKVIDVNKWLQRRQEGFHNTGNKEKEQGRMCRYKKPWSAVKFWNWDIESEKCPKSVFCPGAKKKQWIISPGSFSTVSVHSLSLSWQMSVQDSISLSTSTAFLLHLPAISLSLSLSVSSSPPPLLWGLADLGAYVFIKTAVRSSKWKGRKKKEGELQRPVSWVPEDRALSWGWVSTVCLLLKISLYPHATVCSARFCLVWQKRLQQAHLRK